MNDVLICLTLMAVIGIILCFFGRRMVNFTLPLVVFVIVLRFVMEHFASSQYVLLIAVLAGIAGALLSRFAKRAAFFIVGFLLGILIGSIVSSYLPSPQPYMPYIYMLVTGLIFGFLFVRWNNFFIAAATAYIGGQRLSCLIVFLFLNYNGIAAYEQTDILSTFSYLENYFENTMRNAYPIYILLLTIIFLLSGLYFQNRHGRYRRRR